jgi:hypothetical protein
MRLCIRKNSPVNNEKQMKRIRELAFVTLACPLLSAGSASRQKIPKLTRQKPLRPKIAPLSRSKGWFLLPL